MRYSLGCMRLLLFIIPGTGGTTRTSFRTTFRALGSLHRPKNIHLNAAGILFLGLRCNFCLMARGPGAACFAVAFGGCSCIKYHQAITNKNKLCSQPARQGLSLILIITDFNDECCSTFIFWLRICAAEFCWASLTSIWHWDETVMPVRLEGYKICTGAPLCSSQWDFASLFTCNLQAFQQYMQVREQEWTAEPLQDSYLLSARQKQWTITLQANRNCKCWERAAKWPNISCQHKHVHTHGWWLRTIFISNFNGMLTLAFCSGIDFKNDACIRLILSALFYLWTTEPRTCAHARMFPMFTFLFEALGRPHVYIYIYISVCVCVFTFDLT